MNERIINFEHSIFNVQIKNDLIPSGIEFTWVFLKYEQQAGHLKFTCKYHCG